MVFRVFLLSLLLLLPAPPGRADVSSDLNNFWNANITGPASFKGQAAGSYTLGNVRLRTATRNTQLASMTLPDISAGCGGIDIFAGSFSFVSKDEIVQLAKAIASNAVGYAFELAMDGLCPICASAMSKLRNLAQEMNAGNVNSCETARVLVDSLWDRTTAGRAKMCAMRASLLGREPDYAAGVDACSDPPTLAATEAAGTDEAKDQTPLGNIAWQVLVGGNYGPTDWLKNEPDLAEFFMTLTGTIILRDPDNDGGLEVDYVPPMSGLDADVVKLVAEGGTYTRYRCDDHDKCLYPALQTGTLPQASALQKKVETHIDNLIQDVETDTRPADPDMAFVNGVDLPLYKIINVYASHPGGLMAGDSAALVHIVTDIMVHNYLLGVTGELSTRMGNPDLISAEQYRVWRDNIREVQNGLSKKRGMIQADLNRIFDYVDKIQAIEGFMARALASDQGGRLGFDIGLGPGN